MDNQKSNTSLTVEERKHGHWDYSNIAKQVYKCSVCHRLSKNGSPFCPWCGAIMKRWAKHESIKRKTHKLFFIKEIIGNKINELEILNEQDIEVFCESNDIDAAFLCIPKSSAFEIVQRLYDCGVKNFWNFTHYYIQGDYPEATVENVHLSDILMTLCYSMNEAIDNADAEENDE